MNSFSEILIELRKKNKYTQKYIAKYCDVSVQMVGLWENAGAIPKPSILLKLSQLYKISINELLGFCLEEKDIDDRLKEILIEKVVKNIDLATDLIDFLIKRQ